MSIASLSRFTVPLASNQSSATQGLLMPKLKYRFRVSFENFGVSGSTVELTKQVADAARPTVKFADQILEVYNSKIHYAGKPTWDPLAITLRDDVTNAVTKLVGEQNQKQFDFFEQASATAGGDYKFVTRIEMLDGGNGSDGGAQTLETWELYGCYLASTSYESLSYTGAADPMLIKLSIQYDNASQIGIGSAMGTQGFTQLRGTGTTGNGLY
jgi:hypothetical protein